MHSTRLQTVLVPGTRISSIFRRSSSSRAFSRFLRAASRFLRAAAWRLAMSAFLCPCTHGGLVRGVEDEGMPGAEGWRLLITPLLCCCLLLACSSLLLLQLLLSFLSSGLPGISRATGEMIAHNAQQNSQERHSTLRRAASSASALRLASSAAFSASLF